MKLYTQCKPHTTTATCSIRIIHFYFLKSKQVIPNFFHSLAALMRQFSEIKTCSRHKTLRLLQCEQPKTRRKVWVNDIGKSKKMCKNIWEKHVCHVGSFTMLSKSVPKRKIGQKSNRFCFFQWATSTPPYDLPKNMLR